MPAGKIPPGNIDILNLGTDGLKYMRSLFVLLMMMVSNSIDAAHYSPDFIAIIFQNHSNSRRNGADLVLLLNS